MNNLKLQKKRQRKEAKRNKLRKELRKKINSGKIFLGDEKRRFVKSEYLRLLRNGLIKKNENGKYELVKQEISVVPEK